jgi:hypothetical protein
VPAGETISVVGSGASVVVDSVVGASVVVVSVVDTSVVVVSVGWTDSEGAVLHSIVVGSVAVEGASVVEILAVGVSVWGACGGRPFAQAVANSATAHSARSIFLFIWAGSFRV